MEKLKLIDEQVRPGIISFRKAVLSKELPTYKKKLTELRKLEKEILEIEDKIFGTRDVIKIGHMSVGWLNSCEIAVDYNNSEIVVYEVLPEIYGNGGIIRENRIDRYTFKGDDLCIFDENVIITLRKLVIKSINDIKANYKTMVSKETAKFKKEHPEKYAAGFRPAENFSLYIDTHLGKGKIEDFFKLLIVNIDFVSFYLVLAEENSLKNIYEKYASICDVFWKVAKKPSECAFISKLKELGYVSSFKEPSFKDAKYVIDIIKSETEDYKNAKEKYPEYEVKKKAYYDMCKEITNLENKIF